MNEVLKFGRSCFVRNHRGEWEKQGRTSGDWYIADDDETAMLNEIRRLKQHLFTMAAPQTPKHFSDTYVQVAMPVELWKETVA